MLLLRKTQKITGPIFCLKCQEGIIPFENLSDEQFYMTSEKGVNRDVDKLNVYILPNNSGKTFFKYINNINCNIADDIDTSPEINCNYIEIDSFRYKNTKGSFCLFHLNIASP